MGTKHVRNLRPRILRGVVGETEYDVLVGGTARVDERLAAFWDRQGDVEILESRQAVPSPPQQEAKPATQEQGALPGTEDTTQKKHSGFHGK